MRSWGKPPHQGATLLHRYSLLPTPINLRRKSLTQLRTAIVT
ncbi:MULTISPECIES: hypothetical protein [unclassified Moorena]|nr:MULTISPECIES: hypothetical protein [unclassified Moorena]